MNKVLIIQENESIRCENPVLECAVVSRAQYEQELIKRPYLVFGDIHIIFNLVYQQFDRSGSATGKECRIAITDEGRGERTLDPMEGFRIAIRETEKAKPARLLSITQALTYDREAMAEADYEEDEFHVAILSNSSFSHGAISLFYEGTKDLMADCFPDGCFILPSSVHEVMLLSKPHFLYRLEEAKSILREVNLGRNMSQGGLLSDRIMEIHMPDRTISYARQEKEIRLQCPAQRKKVLAATQR